MCSVVGYIGRKNCRPVILEGLRRLEYRGYDSAGFACIQPDIVHLACVKAVGKLDQLVLCLVNDPIDGFIGIGHTRWATHGGISPENAHPHFNCHESIAIVHNGIIENSGPLKRQLADAGHFFVSQTDSEVIAHLFDVAIHKHQSLKEATIDTIVSLEGSYAFLAIAEAFPDCVIAVRKRSPLCIGFGDQEMFLASDPLAFAGKCSSVLYLPDETFALVFADHVELYDFAGKLLTFVPQELSISWHEGDLGGYEHYMLKEIYEQKRSIRDTVAALHVADDADLIWNALGIQPTQARDLTSINLIGCGTSFHASLMGAFFFEHIARIPARAWLASEFRYLPFFPEKNSIYIAVSQSGETADTLEALRMLNAYQLPTVALSNVASSTMVREAVGYLLTHAGYEVAVVSTKAFSTQLTVLYWLAYRIAAQKGLLSTEQLLATEHDLIAVAAVLEGSIEHYKERIERDCASIYAQHDRFVFLGRHISYPFAMEAALKLKEISYLFVQTYPAGELKHGALALIDHNMPVFVFSCLDPIVYQKLLGNVQEVKARGAQVTAFAFEGQQELCELADHVYVIPRVNPLLGPLAMTGLMQFFSYQVAKMLDRPIDKPRNLAKSVTVE